MAKTKTTVSFNYKAIGILLRSPETKKFLRELASKEPETKDVETKLKFHYQGRKQVKEFEGKRAGITINYRLNGHELTNALLNSGDRRSHRLGRIRERKGE